MLRIPFGKIGESPPTLRNPVTQGGPGPGFEMNVTDFLENLTWIPKIALGGGFKCVFYLHPDSWGDDPI